MPRDMRASAEGFDIDGIRQLLELMETHDVREFKVQSNSSKYVIRRGPQEVVAAPAAPAAPAPVAAAPASAPAPAATTEASAPADSDAGLVDIVSPTVGTFYQSSSPGEPPFVKVGDQVSNETVVCIVEAMKVFNQIPAEASGTIAKLLVKDGDAVEFGQPLFKVKPN